MKAKKTIGFYLIALSTILAIASLVLYKDALMKNSMVSTLLILAAAAGVCAIVLAVATGKEVANFVAAAHAVLLMAAIGISISPMVNEIALVYAGLNPKSNLSGYITFAVVACIGWLVSLIASFTGMAKKEA